MAGKDKNSSVILIGKYVFENFKKEFTIEELLKAGDLTNQEGLKNSLKSYFNFFSVSIKMGIVTSNLGMFTRQSDPDNDPEKEFLKELKEQILIKENSAKRSVERGG